MNKRIFYFDALRAMAIIGIVFCHVSLFFIPSSLNTPNLYFVAFLDCLRDFSIPIFVMLSGILLINREETFKVFFKKRLSRLLIPFVFWVAVYILYSHDFSITNMLNIFLGASGSLGVTFWFVWMIIMMYFGIFIINKLIGHFKSDKVMYALALLSLAYFAIVRMGLFNPYPSRTIYFASFITYIIIGYVIANNDFIGERLNTRWMVVLTLIVSVILYLHYICGFVYPRSQLAGTFVYLGYFNPLLLALSVNIFTFFKYLSRTDLMRKVEDSRFGDGLALISRYSFGIYLIHYLIIDVLKLNVLRYIPNPNPFICIIPTVIATVIISFAILWILARIPYLKRFSGVN